jgi:hypothetical protein
LGQRHCNSLQKHKGADWPRLPLTRAKSTAKVQGVGCWYSFVHHSIHPHPHRPPCARPEMRHGHSPKSIVKHKHKHHNIASAAKSTHLRCWPAHPLHPPCLTHTHTHRAPAWPAGSIRAGPHPTPPPDSPSKCLESILAASTPGPTSIIVAAQQHAPS